MRSTHGRSRSVASHDFVKPHRHTPAEDTLLRRVSDVVWVCLYVASNLLSDAIEDGAARVASVFRRRRAR